VIKKQIIFFISCFILFGFTAQNGIQNVPLLDLKGNTFKLNQLHKYKATAIFFMSPECPLCQNYTLTINQLIKKYNGKAIDFIGVVPTKDFLVADILKYKRSYKSNLNLVRDSENKLVKKLGATITPEVFLVDSKGVILYSGRIDNWAYELGKKRTVITAHDLVDAIESVLNNKPVKIKKTKAVGCFIE
jgi:thiol-disulfide isomerase/thioredoxin